MYKRQAETAKNVVMGISTAAQWALNVAMTANPIGIVIVAIGALVGAFIVLDVYKRQHKRRALERALTKNGYTM